MNSPGLTRPPAVAGLFYTEEPRRLRSEVESMIDNARSTAVNDRILGLVVPHAGFMYSGPTAAAAYRLLKSIQPDIVVIVSPSHREAFKGVSACEYTGYSTPLGTLPVHEEFRDALIRTSPVVFLSMRGHREEHAIEVQLPFLQSVCPSCSIVPLVMGDQATTTCMSLGDTMAAVVALWTQSRIMMIASSDLSHFHSQSDALELDNRTEHQIRLMDPIVLSEAFLTGKAEACGGGPIAAVLRASRKLGANDVAVLDRCTSGDVTGERRRVVGYMSAAFTAPARKAAGA
jgi:AmmeMemoRadiSam system protein B